MKGLQSRPRKITLLLKTNPSPRDQAKKRRRARERANAQTVMGGRNVPGPVPVPGVKGTSVPVEAPAPTVADELIAMATMDALSAVVAPLGRAVQLLEEGHAEHALVTPDHRRLRQRCLRSRLLRDSDRLGAVPQQLLQVVHARVGARAPDGGWPGRGHHSLRRWVHGSAVKGGGARRSGWVAWVGRGRG